MTVAIKLIVVILRQNPNLTLPDRIFIISFPWFSKELKMSYQRTTGFVASSLYFSFTNQYSLGGGFRFQ